MKKKLFIYLLLLMPAFIFQSCLKDQEDTFDKDAGLRVQETIEKVETILNSSTYGWVANYYPEEDQSYGGYAYTFQFKDGQVKVGSELVPGEFEESSYKMKNYRGVTLSFDTYNEIFHFFARPTQDNYEGYHGDVEFAVDSIADDVIKVRGIRNGCVLYFHKLHEEPASYLQKVVAVEESFLASTLEGTVGTTNVIGTFDIDNRQLVISNEDGSNEQASAFTFTDKGLSFYKPFVVDGNEVSEVSYDAATNMMTATAASGAAINLQGKLPADYVRFEQFAGDYTFVYYKSIDVKLVPDAQNNCYYMTGLNDNFSVRLDYNKSKGCLELHPQIVGESNGYNVWLCAWGLAGGGNLTPATGAGMETKWNEDAEHPIYQFVANSYTGLVTDSFILWLLDNDGNSGGQCSDRTFFMNGSSQLPYVKRLIKK